MSFYTWDLVRAIDESSNSRSIRDMVLRIFEYYSRYAKAVAPLSHKGFWQDIYQTTGDARKTFRIFIFFNYFMIGTGDLLSSQFAEAPLTNFLKICSEIGYTCRYVYHNFEFLVRKQVLSGGKTRASANAIMAGRWLMFGQTTRMLWAIFALAWNDRNHGNRTNYILFLEGLYAILDIPNALEKGFGLLISSEATIALWGVAGSLTGLALRWHKIRNKQRGREREKLN